MMPVFMQALLLVQYLEGEGKKLFPNRQERPKITM